MATISNAAPQTRWHSCELACGTKRYRLFVDGRETPYFIDRAQYRAHFAYGSRVALWGAGLGQMTRAGYRIAGCFGTFAKVTLAKHRAEQLALEAA